MRPLQMVLSIFLVAVGVLASPEDRLWPLETEQLKPDPGIHFGQLETGLRYAVMANKRPEGEAFIQFYVGVGSLDEAEHERGIAHFVEHMAFNGSKNIAEDELVKMLQRLGLAFGADANAYTSFDRTVYTLDLPGVGDEVLDTSLMILREVAGNLLIEPGAVDRERGIIQSERRVRKSPAARAGEKEIEFLLAGTRYPDRLPIGTEAVIDTVSAETLMAFYRRFYRPDNAFLVVTGDIDVGDIEARIRVKFSDWHAPDSPIERLDVGTVTPMPGSVASFQSSALTDTISFYQLAPAIPPQDSRVERIRAIRQALALALFNRRFATVSQAENAPFVGARFSWGLQNDVVEVGRLALTPLAGDPMRGIEAAEQAIRQAQLYGFTDAELAEQRANLQSQKRRLVEEADKRHSKRLAGWLVGAYASGGVPLHPGEEAALIDVALAELTPSVISAVFAPFWTDEPAQVFVRGKEASDVTARRAWATYLASRQTDVAPPLQAEQKQFAYQFFGPAGTVATRHHDADSDMTKITFENGVRLTLKPTDFEEKTVLMRLSFGGGYQAIGPDRAAAATLARFAFSAAGLGQHSYDALDRLTAGRLVRTGLEIGSDRFSFSSRTIADDALLQLQLWAAYMTDPGYRDEALGQFRRTVEALYDTLEKTPGQVLRLRGGALLASGDTRFSLPSKTALEAVNLADMQALLDPLLSGSDIEIAVVGRFDEAAIVDAVAETFGALARRSLQVPDRPFKDVAFAEPGTHRFYHQGEADQAIFQLNWPTVGRDARRETATLSLLQRVIGDRLREELREALGATYSPSVASSPTRYGGYGRFSVTVLVKPEDLDITRQTIDQVIADIAGGVALSDDLIDRARTPLLEQLESNLQNNAYWLRVLERAQSDPDDLEPYAVRRQIYLDIMSKDLQQAAKTYLRSDTQVLIDVVHQSLHPAAKLSTP